MRDHDWVQRIKHLRCCFRGYAYYLRCGMPRNHAGCRDGAALVIAVHEAHCANDHSSSLVLNGIEGGIEFLFPNYPHRQAPCNSVDHLDDLCCFLGGLETMQTGACVQDCRSDSSWQGTQAWHKLYSSTCFIKGPIWNSKPGKQSYSSELGELRIRPIDLSGCCFHPHVLSYSTTRLSRQYADI